MKEFNKFKNLSVDEKEKYLKLMHSNFIYLKKKV